MATELDNRCPICLDSWDKASFVMPCCHRFCFTCIRRWADTKPECPLCKGKVESIVHSVRGDDDFEEYVVRPPSASPPAVHHVPHSPAASPPPAAGAVPRAPVGSLRAETWATRSWVPPALLEPLLPWLHEVLGLIFEDDHLQAAIVQDFIMSSLVLVGLDEEVLGRLLGLFLHDRTAAFVNDLIDAVVRLCSREAHRLLGLEDAHAAGEQEGSPAASHSPSASRGASPAPSPGPSSSPATGHDVDELPSTSTAALGGDPGSPPSAPVPILGEQEEPQEEPEETAPDPPTSSEGRECSPAEPQRPRKRRASSPEASSPPNKRPARRES